MGGLWRSRVVGYRVSGGRSFKVISEIDGKFAYETKGIWEVEGAFMAGPFINYAVYDEKNSRYLIIEGFTYAPSVRKRNLQFELESIIRSAKIN